MRFFVFLLVVLVVLVAASDARRRSSRSRNRSSQTVLKGDYNVKYSNGRSPSPSQFRRATRQHVKDLTKQDRIYNDRVNDGLSKGAQGLEAPRKPRRNDDFVNDQLPIHTKAPFPKRAPANAANSLNVENQTKYVRGGIDLARLAEKRRRSDRKENEYQYDLHNVQHVWDWDILHHGSRIAAMDAPAVNVINAAMGGFVPEQPPTPWDDTHAWKVNKLAAEVLQKYDPDVPGKFRPRSTKEILNRMRLGLIDPADMSAKEKYTSTYVASYDDPVTQKRNTKFRRIPDNKALELLYPTFVTDYTGNTDPIARFIDGGLPVRPKETLQAGRIFQVPNHQDIKAPLRSDDQSTTTEALELGGMHDTDTTMSTDPTLPLEKLYDPMNLEDPKDLKTTIPGPLPGSLMENPEMYRDIKAREARNRAAEFKNPKYGLWGKHEIYGIPHRGAKFEDDPFDTKDVNYQGLMLDRAR